MTAEGQCSSCLATMPLEKMHFLPWWNPVGAFFMAFRCPACFGQSLQETTERIESWDEEAEKLFASFLEIWKIFSHFPETQKDSPRETANAVLDLVKATDGKAFAPLLLGALSGEGELGGCATIGPMSEALRKALTEAEEELRQEGMDPDLLTYEATVKVSQRIEAGEEGLHDPDNSGDKLALLLARME